MSEETDDTQKTEDPTQKKVDEARSHGQVAISREINTWLMLAVGTLIIAMMLPMMMTRLRVALLPFIESPHLYALNIGATVHLMKATVFSVFLVVFLPLLFFFVIAMAGPIIQNGLVFSPKALEVKWDKFNPVNGAKRLFSVRQLIELPKGIVKLAIVGGVGVAALMPAFFSLDIIPSFALPDFLDALYTLILKMLIVTLAAFFVIAVLDLIFQRFQHLKQLRMSRQELRDEFKQSEGDPTARQRLRQVRQERARARMMQAVPEADVVVTNPTHFAVALKYEPEAMGAPRLVAKGVDLIAQKIREVAEEHGIAIIENPPLARALYAAVDLDEEVPPEHYQAVAEVISYVWNIEGRRMPKEAGIAR
jgi:flagellar biosynthesis protein FlhB